MAKYKELHPFRDTGQPLRSRWGPPQQTHLRSKKSNGTCREDPETLLNDINWAYQLFCLFCWQLMASSSLQISSHERDRKNLFKTLCHSNMKNSSGVATENQNAGAGQRPRRAEVQPSGSWVAHQIAKGVLFLFHGHFTTFQRKLFDISWFLRRSKTTQLSTIVSFAFVCPLWCNYLLLILILFFCLVMISLFQTCQCFLAAHHWRRWRVRYKDLETSISAGTSLAKCIFTSSWSSDVQLVASSTQMQLSYVQFISSGWL